MIVEAPSAPVAGDERLDELLVEAGPSQHQLTANDPTPTGAPAVSIGRTPRLRAVLAGIGWGAIGAVLIVAAWQVLAWRVDTLPTPAETFTELGHQLGDALHNGGPNDKGVALLLGASLRTVMMGFVAAGLVGVPLGLAMGASRRVWQITNPAIQFLRPVSPLAWFPIWLIVFKDAPNAAVCVIFITSLWPIVLNTATGAASVPQDQRNVARVFRLKRRSYVRHVLVPHTMPSVVSGLRVSMGTAWMVIVAVEMLSGASGIGGKVWEAYNALNLAQVTACIVLIGVVGLIIDFGFLRLARAVAPQENHA